MADSFVFGGALPVAAISACCESCQLSLLAMTFPLPSRNESIGFASGLATQDGGVDSFAEAAGRAALGLGGARPDLVAVFAGVEAQQLRKGIGVGEASGVVHHAADSAGWGLSSGSTSTSSSSPR